VKKKFAFLLMVVLFVSQASASLDLYYNMSNSFNDLSGNNIDGAANGGVISGDVNGEFGEASSFDGSDDWVNIGEPSQLSPSSLGDSFAVSFWFNVSSLPSSSDNKCGSPESGYLFAKGSDDANDNLAVQLCNIDGNPTHELYLETASGTVSQGNSQFTFQKEKYYHYVLDYNGTHANIFLDNTLKHSLPATGDLADASGSEWSIGSRGGDRAFFNGAIDEVKIFDSNLSSSEISNLYSSNQLAETTNTAPTFSNPDPADGALGISKTTKLSIKYNDDEGDSGYVEFYNASDDSLIENVSSVSNGSVASTSSLSLDSGKTFEWYVVGSDGSKTTTSQTYSFTTASSSSFTGPEPVFHSYFNNSCPTIKDNSGNNYDLTCGSENPSSVSSINNFNDLKALSFPGLQYGNVNGEYSGLEIGNDVSYSFWVKPDQIKSDGDPEFLMVQTIGGETEPTNTQYQVALTSSGTLRVGHEYGAGSNSLQDTSYSLNSGSTYFVSVNRDVSKKEYNVFIFNSSEMVSSETLSYSNDPTGGADTKLFIGTFGEFGDKFGFDGVIDEPWIFNQTLSSTQAQALYDNNGFSSNREDIVLSNPNPSIGEKISNDNTFLNISLVDYTSSSLNYVSINWNSNDTVLLNSSNVANNSVVSTKVRGLKPNNDYTWTVKASDGENSTSKTYNFRTGYLEKGDYSFVIMPDTQEYSKSYPSVFTNQTEFIAKHSDHFKYAIHNGDLVNNPTSSQWNNAQTSMQILNQAGVPYSAVWGNHDCDGCPGTVDRSLTDYNNYFGLNSGTVSSDGSLNGNANNYYDLFSAGSEEFMVLNLGMCPTDSALTWANSTLENHSSRKVIVNSHIILKPEDYLTGLDKFDNSTDPHTGCGDFLTSNGNNALQVWNKMLKYQDNVFAVTSGHYQRPTEPGGDGEAYLDLNSVEDSKIHFILSDYQFENNGGNGWLRTWNFYPDETRMEVETYSPYIQEYNFTQDESYFNLDINLSEYNGADKNSDLANIVSPLNQTYNTDTIDLNVTSREAVDTWKYSLDGASNQTFTPNTTLTGLSGGSHDLMVWAEFSDGNVSKESVSFSVFSTDNNKSLIEACSNGGPFCYTGESNSSSSNPESLSGSLVEGESRTFTWKVNATGSAGDYNFFGFYNSTVSRFSETFTSIKTLTIQDNTSSNSLPSADFTTSTSDLSVSTDASSSSDSDGTITGYEWDWTSDGTYEDTGQTSSHTYPSNGTYDITLRVTDNDGATDTTTKSVSVSSSTSDDGSDGGGGSSGGDGTSDNDTTDSTESTTVEGTKATVQSPHFKTRYYGSLLEIEEGGSKTIIINGNEHTFEVVSVNSNSQATVRIDGSSTDWSEDNTREVDGATIRNSDVVDTNNNQSGVVALSTQSLDLTSPEAYFSYNYSVNESGSVELLYRETGENSWNILDTVSSSSSVTNTFRNVSQGLEKGTYEVAARVNKSGNSSITQPTGFYVGQVPDITILRPEDGSVYWAVKGSSDVEVPLDYKARTLENGSVVLGQYYSDSNGNRYVEGFVDDRKVVDSNSGIIETIVEVYTESWYLQNYSGLGILLDYLNIEDEITFYQNTTMNVPGAGSYTGYANYTDNSSLYNFSGTSIGQRVTVKETSPGDGNYSEYVEQRDSDGNHSLEVTNKSDRSLGNNTLDGDLGDTDYYYNAWIDIFEPNPGSVVKSENLSNVSVNLDFDFVANSTAPVNKTVTVSRFNSSKNVSFMLDPFASKYEISVKSGMFGNGTFNEGNYTVSGKTYYSNGSVIENVRLSDYSFKVEKKLTGTSKCRGKGFYSAVLCYVNPLNYGENVQIGTGIGLFLFLPTVFVLLIPSAITRVAGREIVLLSMLTAVIVNVWFSLWPQVIGLILLLVALLMISGKLKKWVVG